MSDVTNETPAPEPAAPVDEPTDQPAPSDEPAPAPQAEEAPAADSQEAAPSAESPDETSQPNDEQPSQPAADSRLSDAVPAGDIPVGDDGTVDPYAFRDQLRNEMRADMRFQESERRAWAELETQYPQLKDNENLRKIILSHRINDVQTGGDGSLQTSAKTVMDEIAGARTEGKTDARVNVKTEKKAGLSKASAPRGEDAADTRAKLESGDPNAIQGVLTGWLDEGKI